MANKMLIDAAHPEETRVVVVRGNRVEEFDYESTFRKQLRGNIYLAKVTRVEPSLQAAFIDYGGNRHGFLAFNEIHPDYYQIPQADRAALLREEELDAQRLKAIRAKKKRAKNRKRRPAKQKPLIAEDTLELVEIIRAEETPEAQKASPLEARVDPVKKAEHPASESLTENEEDDDTGTDDLIDIYSEHDDEEDESELLDIVEDVPVVAGHDEETLALDDDIIHEDDIVDLDEIDDDDEEETASSESEEEDDDEEFDEEAIERELNEIRQRRRRKAYRIQDVIRKNQIVLVQVQKEERGNKGAALTTYLSLAGRFTVLMANSARGGGISRKITNIADRKRLREIVDSLNVPEGMGLIVRTAGASKAKAEVKRDYDYLLRIWESTRQLTLKSTAPTLVYEESDLIKRSIRDLYNKDIDEILVSGEEQFREAKNFMKALMPSHARNVKHYKDPEPLFMRYQVEKQLNAIYSPTVNLKSGGYIVINQTEALVAIDVNSGKSTREHSIEETALATNLEAIEEVARQLRLRDLAGLIVIDFIDMNERRNNKAIERRAKEVFKSDRARIQIGRISSFGLMEMSRQRMRSGMLEGSTTPCHHCQGTGTIRSVESIALNVLRNIEDVLMSAKKHSLEVMVPQEVALYILNKKRPYLRMIERQFNTFVHIVVGEQMHGANFSIEKHDLTDADADIAKAISINNIYADHEDGNEKSGRRDTGRRGRKSRPAANADAEKSQETARPHANSDAEAKDDASGATAEDDPARKSRGRGRRNTRTRNNNRGRQSRGRTTKTESVQETVVAGDDEEDNLIEVIFENDDAGTQQGNTNKKEAGDTAGRRRRRRTPLGRPRRSGGRGRKTGNDASGNTAASENAENQKTPPAKTAQENEDASPSRPEKGDKAVKTAKTPPTENKPVKTAQPNGDARTGKAEKPKEPEPVSTDTPTAAPSNPASKTPPPEVPEAPKGPKRTGWWSR